MSRRAHIAFFIIVGLVIVAVIAQHFAAGFTLPVPWPDESSFLWQAISVQRGNTLFAPELNVARDVMWMPPGYLVVVGLLFKMVGASLVAARMFSLACMLATFAAIAMVLRRHPYPLVTIVMLGAVILTVPFIAIGNAARMDALVLCMGAVALMLFDRERDIAALAVVFLSPLVHPAGLFLCFAAVGHMISSGRWKPLRLTRGVSLVFILIVAAWAWYLTYVTMHWTDFRSDMAHQMIVRTVKTLPLFDYYNRILLAAFLIVVAYGYRRNVFFSEMTWFALGFWCIYGTGLEAWYECYFGVALVLMMALMPSVIMGLSRAWFPKARGPALRLGAAALALGVLVFLGTRVFLYQRTQSITANGAWHGMRAQEGSVEYLTAADRGRVEQYLASLEAAGKSTLVQFLPEADALFYIDKESPTVRFCQGTFYSFTPDVYIVHTSRYIPDWWTAETQRTMAKIGIRLNDSSRTLTAHDSTERIAAFDYPRPWEK